MADAAFAVTQGTTATASLTNTTYGACWNFWPFKADEQVATNYIVAQTPDNIILVGTLAGKGSIFRGTLAGDPIVMSTITTGTFTANVSGAVVSVSGPTGGVGQFKGLSQSSTQDLYVQVICLGVQPMYYTTWAL